MPGSGAAARRASSTANSTSASALRARASSATPAGVSSTRRVVRTNSTSPSWRSSSRIARDSGDCDMCRRSAARPKCSSSATATKYRSCRSSIGTSTISTYRRPPISLRRAAEGYISVAMAVSTDEKTLQGEGALPKPAPHVLVLFGATGDLARRKLLPGLFHLEQVGLMPEDYRIVGTSLSELDDEKFREHVRGALDEFCRMNISDEDWEPFRERLSYVPSK